MIPSVLMTRPAGDAAAPPQAETVTLTDLSHLTPQQIASLPAAELARLQLEADGALRHAKSIVASIEDALDHRYGQRARQARAAQAKDTGTVRFEDNGVTVVADLPKKVEWNQNELSDLVERIKADGEDPREYVEISLRVSERKYSSWPSYIRKAFEPARTVKAGRETFELIAGEA
jgi:hypothetical protein